MSGPKSGNYVAAAERRRQLERQAENEIKQRKENIRKLKEDVKAKKAQLEITRKENEASRTIPENRNDNTALKQRALHIEGLLETNKVEFRHVNNNEHENIVVKKISQGKLDFSNLQEKIKEEDALDPRLKDFSYNESINNIDESEEAIVNKEIIKFGANVTGSKQESIMFGKNSTSIIEEQIANKPVLDHSEIIEELNEEYFQLNDLIENYLLNMQSSSRKELLGFKESLDNIVSDQRLDSSYKLSQLRIRKEAFLLTKDKYDIELKYFEEQKDKFNNLYEEYEAICEILDEEAEEIDLNSLDIVSTMSLLEEKVKEKREELNKDIEARYVSESINEVMEELGYDIVASDYMTAPKRNVMHNIYDFGDKNVLNVYTSDNGSLMFEVTGIKEKEELSSSDKLRIKEGMDKFCPQYQKVKEALEAKGISITNENLLPADVRFAKAIDLESKVKAGEKSKKSSRRNKNNKLKYKTL
ncbi:MAG: hypothetical protein WDA24_11005 [Tissierellales bacterium]